jgi:thymidylate synthase (FAD)
MEEWLDGFGVTPDATLTEAESVVGYAAKSCYQSFRVGINPNIERVRDDWDAFFANIIRQGHGSVMEHATYTYAIEGCTRVFTAEMNRHRAGVAISERSLRYCRFDDIVYWIPRSIATLDEKSRATCGIFDEVFAFVEEKYKQLEHLWDVNSLSFADKKKVTSMMRRIIPMGVCTGVVYTFSLRALRHILTLRTSEAAEEEIAYVCGMIMDDICKREPRLMALLEEHPKI